ncbi:MAG: hypothetical protein ACETWG_07730 [Candidatus Neomarinimicrobiota bacterium]
MVNENKPFNIQNALNLLSTRRDLLPMVSLSEIEQSQSILVWAAVFFGIFAALAGAVISLLTTSYNNLPVIYILGLALVSYLCFFVIFVIRGFHRRDQIVRSVLEPNLSEPVTLGERLSALENWVRSMKMHHDLKNHVFDKQRSVNFQDFNRKIDELLPFEPDDPRRQKFVQKLLAEGMIIIDKTETDNWMVAFEDNFQASF